MRAKLSQLGGSGGYFDTRQADFLLIPRRDVGVARQMMRLSTMIWRNFTNRITAPYRMYQILRNLCEQLFKETEQQWSWGRQIFFPSGKFQQHFRGVRLRTQRARGGSAKCFARRARPRTKWHQNPHKENVFGERAEERREPETAD